MSLDALYKCRSIWSRVGGAMLLTGALGLGGCSGSQQEEEQLEATEENAEEGAAAAGAEAAEGAEETASAEVTEGADASDAGADDTAAIEGDGTSEAEAVEQLTDTASTPVESVPAPSMAPSGSGIDPSRVVRFVKLDEAGIHGGPQDSAELVGKLLKGDRVLIVEENGWGRIADGMFIKLDALANRAVPRHRQPAVWYAPAH